MAERVTRSCPNTNPHPPHEWDFIRDCPGVDESEDTTRYTIVKLRVAWNPGEQDHPMNWDYETLLECEVDFIDYE
jgi:hypothetical protein